MQFSPDGTMLLVGFTDGTFRVLEPATLETLLEFKAHDRPVMSVDMSPKMDYFLTAGGNMIKLWNRAGKHIGNFAGHATTIWDAEISKDGKHAVSSAYNKTFLLWDAYNGVIASHMRGHEDVTPAVAISPDDRFIASGSNDRTIRIWDLNTRQVVRTMQGPAAEILDVAYSPDGELLSVCSVERNIRVYDVEKGTLRFLLKGHRAPVRKTAFSPDGRFLVSASEDVNMILWDMETGEKIHTYLDNEGMLMDVLFHPDGRSVYSISRAGDLSRWELAPEIFVVRYFGNPYREELDNDPLFMPRQKGESRNDYQSRLTEADSRKKDIIDSLYSRYLLERKD